MNRTYTKFSLALPSFTQHKGVRYAILCLAGFLLAACENAPSAVDPRGPAAARIADIWWFTLIVGGVVYVAVVAYLLVALFRRRQRDEHAATLPVEGVRDEAEDLDVLTRGSRVVLWAGIVAPAIILLTVLATPRLRSMRLLCLIRCKRIRYM